MTAGRTVLAQNQHWNTPKKYVDAVTEVLGNISLDPCSNDHSIVGATTSYKLPEHDGLTQQWNADTIYVNPPYGRDPIRKTTIKHWFAKCAEAHKAGSEVIAMVPVATNTSHWKSYVFGSAVSICFLAEPRVKFRINNSEQNKGCPMAVAIIYWGANPTKFTSVFSRHGNVVSLL